jgi:hypothetical protein
MDKRQICLVLAVILLLTVLFKSAAEHFQNTEIGDAVLTTYVKQYDENVVKGEDYLTSDCYISCAPGAVSELKQGIELNDELLNEFKKEEAAQLKPVNQTLYPGYYINPSSQ